MRPPDIDEAMRRTRGYWYDDGLADIAIGCIFLIIALLFTAQTLLPPGFARGSLAALALPVVVIGGWLIAGKLVRMAKERITYPRTGYVAYARARRRFRPLVGLVGGIIGASLAFLLSTRPAFIAWIPALQGILIGALFLVIAFQAGVVRYTALAALSALFGLGAALADVGDILGAAIYFGATGVALCLSGVLTLRHYLRHTEPPAEG